MMKEISKSNVFEVSRSYINKCSEIVKRLKGKNKWMI